MHCYLFAYLVAQGIEDQPRSLIALTHPVLELDQAVGPAVGDDASGTCDLAFDLLPREPAVKHEVYELPNGQSAGSFRGKGAVPVKRIVYVDYPAAIMRANRNPAAIAAVWPKFF